MIYGSGRIHESPGKEAARTLAYASLSRSQLYNRKHIVIPSRECGDIKFLKRCGVSMRNILAFDLDASAIVKSSEMGVNAYRCPIEFWHNFVNSQDVASINVDLCQTLVTGLPVLEDICTSLWRPWKGNVFFTYVRGRDGMKNDLKRESLINRANLGPLRLKRIFKYQSFSAESIGSPMGLAILSR